MSGYWPWLRHPARTRRLMQALSPVAVWATGGLMPAESAAVPPSPNVVVPSVSPLTTEVLRPLRRTRAGTRLPVLVRGSPPTGRDALLWALRRASTRTWNHASARDRGRSSRSVGRGADSEVRAVRGFTKPDFRRSAPKVRRGRGRSLASPRRASSSLRFLGRRLGWGDLNGAVRERCRSRLAAGPRPRSSLPSAAENGRSASAPPARPHVARRAARPCSRGFHRTDERWLARPGTPSQFKLATRRGP